MTNFQKVKHYYQYFDEWGRLDTPAGQLELQIVLEIIDQYIPPNTTIFDLGGGAGRYTYELASRGFEMHLADLSPDLITIARKKLSNFPFEANVKSIEILNAIDLSCIPDNHFDHVLLFGPLYHLTDSNELRGCLEEVYRVLKQNGRLITSYIPYLCGLSSILERSFTSPSQVNASAFVKVFMEGSFENQSSKGFQEGNFMKTEVLSSLLQKIGFQERLLRSIRGIGYKQEKNLLELRETQPAYYSEILNILNATAREPGIVETCGHAIYIGEKVKRMT